MPTRQETMSKVTDQRIDEAYAVTTQFADYEVPAHYVEPRSVGPLDHRDRHVRETFLTGLSRLPPWEQNELLCAYSVLYASAEWRQAKRRGHQTAALWRVLCYWHDELRAANRRARAARRALALVGRGYNAAGVRWVWAGA